ncbi:MAG: phosphoribosylformylglycinamidine synthase subunit PurS [Deltaproteobacteria bacterium]|nr:phosphoribosylformylglycinamidine synthase subunit PurS [Deltaproteobacteria bacterium]
MPHILEIALKPDIFDAEGENIKKKAKEYFNIDIEDVRVINIIAINADFSEKELDIIAEEFTNPVTQIFSYNLPPINFDWTIWAGFKVGVKDNGADCAKEAIEDFLKIKKFGKNNSIHTSKRYCITDANLTYQDIKKIADELLANDIISESKIYNNKQWNFKKNIADIIPQIKKGYKPKLEIISVNSAKTLNEILKKRGIPLVKKDVSAIYSYFNDNKILKKRAEYNLTKPTDLELECIAQARSDHCCHNTFRGLYRYFDKETGKRLTINNLFAQYIKNPTLKLKKDKKEIVSVLWDNAGIVSFNNRYNYAVTGETHNSPSNLEAYGGAITGILGVFRDIMGAGKGAKPIMGSFGFCVGDINYKGNLKPKLHPKRLLYGVIEGVKDGGNKSGVPTSFGSIIFNDKYIGKSLVFVTAIGIMPAKIKKEPSEIKKTEAGHLIIMSGGLVGKDGIHGATASSEILSSDTPASHVQIGDPYTQKKMQDFLIEARDKGLIEYITDNGAGGLSGSVCESAYCSGGAKVDLSKVPLKYDSLDFWEIWVSESQERMTIAISPKNLKTFMRLSKKYGVKSSIIGEYTNYGALHITYKDKTLAYIELDFLRNGFLQSEFDAVWTPPKKRGLFEPVIQQPRDYNKLLKNILKSRNISSKESVIRQYDHEVLGQSIIKPLVGKNRDVFSDAVVIKPDFNSYKGLSFANAILPFYSEIDTYYMTQAVVDEAVRRVISVGGNINYISGIDNFCWPDIRYDKKNNPDGKLKAAKLVRSCIALKRICLSYKIPLISGKDSMYADGQIPDQYGKIHKISAPETLCFSAVSIVEDIRKCVTMDFKNPGDIIYLLGNTKNQLGGSAYYEILGYIGLNVPRINNFKKFLSLYKALFSAIKKSLISSARGIYRGGLAVHSALCCAAGELGAEINLNKIALLNSEKKIRDDILFFSESPGRFIITVNCKNKKKIEKIFEGLPCYCIGRVTEERNFIIKGLKNKNIVSLAIKDIKDFYKSGVL